MFRFLLSFSVCCCFLSFLCFLSFESPALAQASHFSHLRCRMYTCELKLKTHVKRPLGFGWFVVSSCVLSFLFLGGFVGVCVVVIVISSRWLRPH